MFAFEQFPVYILASDFIVKLQPVFTNRVINKSLKDQLYRASSSITLNIAEGAEKLSKKDKKNFYVIARGSTQETVAILHLLKLHQIIDENKYKDLYEDLTIISKMLSGLIKKMCE